MAEPAPATGTDDQAVVRRWLAELDQSERAQDKWLVRARKIIKRYREEITIKARRYALLYSNTQTIMPAIYARPPQPVVSRRFKDADPVGRYASEVMERALAFSVDKQEFDGTLKACTQDYVLIARGQAWERYVPTHGDTVTPQISVTASAGGGYEDEDGKTYDAATAGDDGALKAQGEPFKPVVYEESITDYVNWQDFLHSVCRTWDENWWVCRRVYMARAALKTRFGDELGAKIPLDWGDRSGDATKDELTCKAAIYEIWDKSTKKVFWISRGYAEGPLDVRDDPLKLDGFFPCPKPLLGVTANDNLYPTPDYVYWQDQAEEVDELTQRIAELQDALKVRGFYAADEKANLDNLLKSRNTTLIPVPSWQQIKEGGGLKGLIEWWPIDMIAAALKACIELRKQLIDDVYQITGVGDILRGASDPNETATAQGIKAQWGSVRVRDRQKEVQRFARDIIRIKAEVIAETFSIDTLKAMTGVQLPMAAEKQQAQALVQQMQMQAAPPQPGQPPAPPPQVPPQVQQILGLPTWEDVQALIKDNALRQFRIDVETDSTIEPNEQEEKQRMVELLTAVGGFFAQMGPIVQQFPPAAPMFGEFLKAAVRRFRAGRELEDSVEKAMDQAAQGLPPAQGPQAAPVDKGPTPQELAIEAQRAQTERMKVQGEIANDQAGLQLKAQDLQIKAVVASRDPTPQVQA